MRSCCAEPSEGVGVREAERECRLAACGRWLRDHLQRLCPCLPRSPKREPEPTVHGTEVPTCRAPRTGVRRKGRKHSVGVEPAPNTSRSASEATLPPEDTNQLAAVKEKQRQFWARRLSSGTTLSRNISWSLHPARDADQPATGQLLPWSRPGSVASDALTASSSNRGHDEGPEEELKMMGWARRLAWEPEHVPSVIDASQPSSTLEGQVLHHLVQEEHLGPTVAELEEPRQMQLAPETQGGPSSWLEPVQELPKTPVLELRPVSPASAPAEPEDIPAEASAPRQGPELEPQEPSVMGPRATAVMVPGLAEPEPCPDPMSPWDIPGVVSAPVPGPELEPQEPSGMGPGATAIMVPDLAEPEPCPDPMSPWDIPGVVSAPVPGPELEPQEPSGMGSGAIAIMAPGLAEPEPCPDLMSPWDIPGVVSAPVPGPELEPQEPSGMGSGAIAIMAPGLAEPEPCPDLMSPWDIPGVVSAPVPGPELEPHEPSGPGPVASAGMAPGLAEPEADPEPTSTCVAITRDVPRTEEQTILQFPAHLVAEQLTLMCAELYSRIAYGEFKAYLVSQPLMEGTELLGPNVQMVIRQFDAMVSLVISSCLGTVTMTAQDRAQVMEFWIQVAEECLALKNFAALRAILLALQSRPIGRLESTWGHVSWKSYWTYKKLTKRDKEANREWLLKEARAIVKQQLCALTGCQYTKKQVPQGMVPFLGLFLRDMPVDQLQENNDGDGMRQRQLSAQSQKVTVILHEMTIYQHVARLYDLEPEEHVMSFLQAVEPLDEEESYSLSCQLEPPGQGASRKGLLQFFRSHKI